MIISYFSGYDTRQDYAETLVAAAFLAGFLAFLIYGQWAGLPKHPFDILSGEYLPLILSLVAFGGAVFYAFTAALVRRARDAGFPVAVGPSLLMVMAPLLYAAFVRVPEDQSQLVAIYSVLLLDVMLLFLLAVALAIIDRLDVHEEPDLCQPSLPSIPRSGFSAMGSKPRNGLRS